MIKNLTSLNPLKKAVAIFHLLILSFNFCGYQVLIAVLESRADHRLEVMIDNNEFEEAELVELRVPLSNPYQQRFTSFERFHGQVEMKGRTYHYVMRKIEGDVLVLKCLPNDSKDHLKNIAADITGSHSGQQQGNGPVKSVTKIFSPECDNISGNTGEKELKSTGPLSILFSDPLSDTLLAIPHQPPRSFSA